MIILLVILFITLIIVGVFSLYCIIRVSGTIEDEKK